MQSEIPRSIRVRKWKIAAKEKIHGLQKSQSKKISKGRRRSGCRRCDTVRNRSVRSRLRHRHRQSALLKDEVAYGERSPYVNSVRIAVNERPSPDEFGLTFHVLTPLQDSVGIITPSALHFVGTHRGAIVPDIKPGEYRFLLHGMVDRPLEFTLEELKRFPSVSRLHFVECLGNRREART